MNVSPRTVIRGERVRPRTLAGITVEDAAAFRADHAATSKTCNHCGPTLGPKPISEFTRSSASPDGLHWWCKTCQRAAQAAYRRTELGKATRKAYRARSDVAKKEKRYERSERRKALKAASDLRRRALPLNQYRRSLAEALLMLDRCEARMVAIRNRIATCEREIARLTEGDDDD